MATEFFKADEPIPLFRPDLEIYRGPDEEDGYPSYSLYDPVIGQYYRLSWSEMMIMKNTRAGMTPEQLLEYLHTQTTIQPTYDQLKLFFSNALRRNLLNIPLASENLYKVALEKKGNWLWWFLMHYLYFRIHLFQPSEFLKRTLPYVSFLASKPMFILYGILIFYGVSQIFEKWDTYFHTLLYFFSFSGAIAYGIAIIAVKIIHELAHAYTATYYGVRVPSMGVAFLVLWPVLYTDVTEGWKLSSRRQRFYISAAGVITETIIAGLATIGWAWSDPGILQSMFFIVSTTSWFSTLLINLNPAMRFDGYFILSDLWGIDNLQIRAFEYTRWQMRKWFFGIDRPNPEEELAAHHSYGLIIYTIYTWIYRFLLYIFIAVLVYYMFTKALGIFLFILEIAVFIIWPLCSELNQIFKMRSEFNMGKPQKIILTTLAILAAWVILPLPHQHSSVGVVVPDEAQMVYITDPGEVTEVLVKVNDKVKAGDTLITLNSRPLEIEAEELRNDIKIAQSQIVVLEEGEEGQSSYIPSKQAEISTLKERLKAVEEKIRNLNIRAHEDGIVYAWDKDIYPGQFLGSSLLIGKVANLNKLKIVSLLPESLLSKIDVGYNANFWIQGTNTSYKGKIVKIEPFRTKLLEYPQLSSIYQGEIATTQKSQDLELIDTYYTVDMEVDLPHSVPIGTIGYIRWYGPFTSWAGEGIRKLRSLILRESGF